MGSFSIWHWLIVLLVVVVIFGTKKLRNIGSDLGGAVKGFKDGMKSASEEGSDAAGAVPPSQQVGSAGSSTGSSNKRNDANTVDVQAKTKS